jgi:hypothetical protein
MTRLPPRQEQSFFHAESAHGACLSNQSFVCWDLETVPDLAAADRMLDMPKASDTKPREAEDSSDQSAKSADKLVAPLNVVKEAIANPSARA